MAIAYVNKGAIGGGASAASATPALPASVTVGNLLIATVMTQASASVHTWPAGWTQIDQRQWNTGNTDAASFAYRIATGGDTAPTVTLTGSPNYWCQTFQLSGTSGTPISAARSFATGLTGTHSSGSVVTTANDSVVVYVDLANNTTLLTTPAGWTAHSSDTNALTAGVISLGSKAISISGSSSGAISTPGASVSWIQWQQEILAAPPAPSSGSSDITLPAVEFASTAITDTLGTSGQTLASIIALSEAYSGNSSSVTLSSILASGVAIGGQIGSSLVTLPSILASGTARADFIYPVSVTSGMTMAAPAIAAWAEFVTGSGAFTTTASAPTIFWEVVTSTATATTTGTAPKLVDATVTASAVVAGTIVGTATYHVSAVSLASIISGIQFLQDYWDGWAYNLNTGAPSTYENFKFNSFARIGKNYYGCNSTGIHLLSGGTDAGGLIDVTVTLGTSDLATDKIPGDALKNLPAVYVNARSDEPLVLTCRTEGEEYSYTFRASKSPMAVTRVSPGKGLSGTLWQLEVTNQLGSDVEIGGLEPMVSRTTRRI